jgi:predicted nucleic acid-binding protein
VTGRASLYLIDSSVWIPVFRASRALTSLQERARALVQAGAAATTGIVRLELLRGARDDAQLVDLREMLESLHQLPTDERTWDEAAWIGQRLRRAGRSVPTPDLLIAAIAIQYDVVLLHRDADYAVIAQHTRLRAEAHP